MLFALWLKTTLQSDFVVILYVLHFQAQMSNWISCHRPHTWILFALWLKTTLQSDFVVILHILHFQAQMHYCNKDTLHFALKGPSAKLIYFLLFVLSTSLLRFWWVVKVIKGGTIPQAIVSMLHLEGWIKFSRVAFHLLWWWIEFRPCLLKLFSVFCFVTRDLIWHLDLKMQDMKYHHKVILQK